MPFINLDEMRKIKSPAAERRRGFLLRISYLTSLLLTLFLLGGGCARRPLPATFTPLGTAYSAPEDSLGLEAFLALPAARQEVRRDQAQLWLKRATQTSLLTQRLGCLANAAGLAPDDPGVWCEMAELRRWAGDYVQTSGYLDRAEEALTRMDRQREGDRWNQGLRQLVLNRAWLHYDRAEYADARRWIRTLRQQSEADSSLRRILGLVAGRMNLRSKAHEMANDMLRTDAADPDARWVMASLDRAQGRFREAFNYIADVRAVHHHAAECYRDKGEIAELAGEWTYARRWYEESAAAVPLDDGSAIRRLDFAYLDPMAGVDHLPVWVAFNRYYVTGSLAAYAALARERHETGGSPEEREFWAGQLVDATGILLRKGMVRAQALKARGLVFAGKDMKHRARKDLERASRLLGGEGRPDAEVESEIGHLWLLEEDHERARPRLRRALDLDPTLARAWSDLGLCLIMAEQEDSAQEALTRAIDLQPDLASAWYNRGLMHLHAGRWEEARADLSEAARLTPDNPEIGRLLQQVALRLRNQE